MRRGRYIVIEGPDGVGKGTQVELLRTRFTERGIDCHYIREPGGDPYSEVLRDLLKGPLDRLPMAELLTFNAGRVQTLRRIEDEVALGHWVISDRNYFSTLAYQGHGRKMNLTLVRLICVLATEMRRPDLELVLLAPFSVIKERETGRGGSAYFELLGDAFNKRVLRGYRQEAHHFGVPTIDASGSVEEVASQIWKHVEPLLED
jgi:dTMP kinase